MSSYGAEEQYVALLFEVFRQMEKVTLGPLQAAAKYGMKDVIGLLLDHLTDDKSPSCPDLLGNAPLHYAC